MIAALPSIGDRIRQLFGGVAYSGINMRRCCCVEIPRGCCAPQVGGVPASASIVVSGNQSCGTIAQQDLNGAFELRLTRSLADLCRYNEGDLVRPLSLGGTIQFLKLVPEGLTLLQAGLPPIPNWPTSLDPNAKLYRLVQMNINGPNPSGVSFAFISWAYYYSGLGFVTSVEIVTPFQSVFSSRVPTPFACPGGEALNSWAPLIPPQSLCAHVASQNVYEPYAGGHSGTATFALS